MSLADKNRSSGPELVSQLAPGAPGGPGGWSYGMGLPKGGPLELSARNQASLAPNFNYRRPPLWWVAGVLNRYGSADDDCPRDLSCK